MAQQYVPVEQIARSILILRGQRVILDRELAEIYGAITKRLNEQVQRTPSVIVQHRYVQDSNQPGSVRRFACMHFPGAW